MISTFTASYNNPVPRSKIIRLDSSLSCGSRELHDSVYCEIMDLLNNGKFVVSNAGLNTSFLHVTIRCLVNEEIMQTQIRMPRQYNHEIPHFCDFDTLPEDIKYQIMQRINPKDIHKTKFI